MSTAAKPASSTPNLCHSEPGPRPLPVIPNRAPSPVRNLLLILARGTGHSLRQAQGGLCPLPLTLLLAYDFVTCNWTSLPQSGITVILMRFHFDERKSERLRANPKRRIGFEEAQEVFRILTISINARTGPSSIAPSVGLETFSSLSSSRCATTSRESTTTL